jgi:hypothetical protein
MFLETRVKVFGYPLETVLHIHLNTMQTITFATKHILYVTHFEQLIA